MNGTRIDIATKQLLKGEPVIFGTDTVNGIGCAADNEDALKNLYRIKKREKEKPFVMLFDTLEHVFDYFEYSEIIHKIAKAYMPGALTIVHKANSRVPVSLLKNQMASFRIPARRSILELIAYTGKPIASTSLNLTGEPVITDRKTAKRAFDAYIFNNLSRRTVPSTVISLSNKKIKILRQGVVRIKDLKWTE